MELGRTAYRIPKFMVIGHRGHGMNLLQSSDGRMRAIKENTISSFNAASCFPLDFIEFDVQVRTPSPSFSCFGCLRLYFGEKIKSDSEDTFLCRWVSASTVCVCGLR